MDYIHSAERKIRNLFSRTTQTIDKKPKKTYYLGESLLQSIVKEDVDLSFINKFHDCIQTIGYRLKNIRSRANFALIFCF